MKVVPNKYEVWEGSWFGCLETSSLGYVMFDPALPPFADELLEYMDGGLLVALCWE